ncbi:CLUMA_CG009145, isoform A [Clunio marinus]|uniref:CLUMA_CG009145, isoform A n=1 Tax=Clunio marinus TaxID=568069 RepID=A0A1J1I5T2_9DIPT|nr:CLUMA_CG009145, isoform A [Clunio marinus]
MSNLISKDQTAATWKFLFSLQFMLDLHRLEISLLLLTLASALTSGQQHHGRQFQIRAQEPRKSDKDSDHSAATLHQQLRAQQLIQQQYQQPTASSASYEYSDEEEDNVPIRAYQRQSVTQQRQHQQQQHQTYPQQNKKQLTKKQREQLEEELEEEEPDHLAILLGKSQFSCNSRTTGYYADDTVGCQVFHYCQENTKHSWICPEGATFHQVHLICMPPSEENICEQSAKYHFVNDYLYKPINMEEHQSKPNVSLRYHDRYFPESFFTDDRHDYDEERERAPVRHQPKPVIRTQQHQQQSGYRQQQNAYRTPEEINISLSQRRPYFAQTTSTPHHDEEDDEYSYEK